MPALFEAVDFRNKVCSLQRSFQYVGYKYELKYFIVYKHMSLLLTGIGSEIKYLERKLTAGNMRSFIGKSPLC